MASKKQDRNGVSTESPRLTHLDSRGQIRMVDVGAKSETRREAVARGRVAMAPATLDAIMGGALKKGEALAAARIAAIMAAKRTDELIPLCHQLPLDVVEVEFSANRERSTLEIEARVTTRASTGVEMEALVAVGTAALTIYDMAKGIDRAMEIGAIRLVRKTGGKSGDFIRPGEPR
jgi:cyclic pyranopterin monophosphate synthase